uniref:Nucleolus and neural progenitor protein-like N-terminal domain-containing protein n=1 Tax=Pavo cristatus TaxID=9049 RepID=A0A8C9FV44_PAVCR
AQGKMAAPEAAWNRVDVPWPASSSAVAVAAQHPAGPRLGLSCLPALRRRCVGALKWLSGQGLTAEGRVLRALLYVFHSRLLRHRPYLAMQQVSEQLKAVLSSTASPKAEAELFSSLVVKGLS